MEEQMRRALEDVRRETKDEIQKAVGEVAQQTFDGMKMMQENFLAQQRIMQDQFREFMKHMGVGEALEEEQRDPTKGKEVAIDEGLNTSTPIPAPPQQFQTPENHVSPVQLGAASPTTATGPEDGKDEIKEIREKLKAIEGLTKFPGVDLSRMSLVNDLILPPKFKMPDFEKFNGTQDPYMHLLKFSRRMAHYAKEDKLMIFCFQESLEGSAAEWYAGLGPEEVKTWSDVANLFALYYKCNAESSPTRDTLRSMSKRNNESFKEYARRWREVACRVRPALDTEEFSTIFIKTLSDPYHDRLWGFSGDDFTSIMKKGELLEIAIREGRIEGAAPKKPVTNFRKKEGETHLVLSDTPKTNSYQNYQPSFYRQQPYQPTPRTLMFPQRPPIPPTVHQTRPQFPPSQQAKQRVTFTPINGTYAQAFAQLREQGILEPKASQEIKGPNFPIWYNPNATCEYHSGQKGHSIENCLSLKFRIEELLKKGVIALDQPNVNQNPLPQHDSQRINCVEAEGIESFEHLIAPVEPFIISVNRKAEKPIVPIARQPFVLKFDTPQQRPLRDTHRAPWTYNTPTEAANISGISGLTRSGKVYGRGQTSTFQPQEKGKEKEQEAVTDEQTGEFLKYLKHSEYSILDQLNKTPARISILQLLQNSPHHREALDRVLEKAYVTEDISTAQLEGLVGNVTAVNFISFSDDEIPPDGRGSMKALYITATCKGHILPKILVDNGSALNLIPMAVLAKLNIDKEQIRDSCINVRAFDGTQREVIGRIELPLQIGPVVYNVEFQVMDIKSSYNCLLGRPWIHMAGAIPSSLHQKVKMVKDDKLITIFGEESMVGMVSTSTPYIEEPNDVPDCSYRAFEIVNVSRYLRNEHGKVPTAIEAPARQMLRCGLRPGCGLGKNGQGIKWPITIPDKKDGCGLGYRGPGKCQKRTRDAKTDKDWKWLEPLYGIFRKGGTLFGESEEAITAGMARATINVTEKGKEISNPDSVVPCPPGFQLGNWREEVVLCMNLSTM